MLVQFYKRKIFNLAIYMIKDKEDLKNLDIGYSDMLVSFFNAETASGVMGEWSAAQIYNYPSKLKSAADYEILDTTFFGAKTFDHN